MYDETNDQLGSISVELSAIAGRMDDLNHTLERATELLEKISDGLFELNLHLGAGTDPWTGRAAAPPMGRGQGRVKWFDSGRGFGFITGQDDVDYFFSRNSLEPPVAFVQEGHPVSFQWFPGESGPIAMEIQLH